jgi:hypothetical protein
MTEKTTFLSNHVRKKETSPKPKRDPNKLAEKLKQNLSRRKNKEPLEEAASLTTAKLED